MLGCSCPDLNLIRFPVIASPKYDGIRCITTDLVPKPEQISVPVARSMKTIPNEYIYNLLGLWLPPGFDGELVTWTNFTMDRFSMVQSKVMSELGRSVFKYFVFDYFGGSEFITADHFNAPYEERLANMRDLNVPEWCCIVNTKVCNNLTELQDYFDLCLNTGFEGVMFRTPESPYKFGRSTFKQQWLVKLKKFVDAEGKVIGFNELYSNQNEATVGLLGQTERSSHQKNMVPMDTLGSIIVEPFDGGENFSIGTGFTQSDRQTIWDNRMYYLGKIAKYKYQEHGTKDRPRIPVFMAFRDPKDMDPTSPKQQELSLWPHRSEH